MDDLISRQAAIDALGEKPLAWEQGEYEEGLQTQWESDVEAIKALPPAQPERKTGKWIYDGFDHPHGIEWCHCSKCGNCESVDSVYTQVDIYPYCAKCGAKMGVDNE